MSAALTPPEGAARVSYGNWVEQRSAGLGRLGLVGTAVGLGGLCVVLLSLLFVGPIGALVLAGLVLVAITLTGTPVGAYLARRIGFVRARWAGETQWRSGVFSRNPPNATRLPGMLGRTQLLEKTDGVGEPFSVIKDPMRGGYYTIVAKCVPDGPWMEDQDRLDTWVANLAGILATCGHETGLVAAKAIVDTAPDPGDRLASMVDGMVNADAPELARSVMAECAATYPLTSSENVTYFEFTFRGRALNRKGDEQQILAELARRVPGIKLQLAAAGGGLATMLTAADHPEVVHVAYDPAAKPFIERATLAGTGTEITWGEAGPVACQEFWDRLVHDSGTSVTWEMYGAPRSKVTEMALAALVTPHRDFVRKRVAIIYRPHAPDKSVSVSESDANTSRFLAGQSKKRMTAMADLRIKATDKSRQEVAAGAVMVQFSMLVTATVTDPENLDQAMATVQQRAGAVPLRLRRSSGSQAAGFAATLPVGFVPWEHTAVPDKVREYM